MPTSSSLLINVRGAQVDGSSKRGLFGKKQSKYFVECKYGSMQAKTASLPGPRATWQQTFKLPLDGRANNVSLTLMRERSGGKAPVSLGGLSFSITPEVENASPIDRDWKVGAGAILSVGFAAEVPPRPPAPPEPEPEPVQDIVEAGEAIPADPASAYTSMTDMDFTSSDGPTPRYDPGPSPLPAGAADSRSEGLSCGSMWGLLGCLPLQRPSKSLELGPDDGHGTGITGYSPAEVPAPLEFPQAAAVEFKAEERPWRERWGLFDAELS
eukprot:tig00000403_g261.t1